MFVVRKTALEPGLNHVSLPLGAEPLGVGKPASSRNGLLQLTYWGVAFPPGMENRIFLALADNTAAPDLGAGQTWRYIGSVVLQLVDGGEQHVFELMTEHAGKPTGDQLVGEGR